MAKSLHDLTPFCQPQSEDTRRYYLKSPWIDTGWEYATDGCVGVRRPIGRLGTRGLSADDQKRPIVSHLFQSVPVCTEEWPQHSGKKVLDECLACEGRGEVACTCPHCGNSHRTECDKCNGSGRVSVFAPMMIGGRKIAGRYCVAIEALGNVLFCPAGAHDKPLAFCSGELQGLVNPLVKAEAPDA